MTSRTAWVAGLGAGLSWTSAFASGDLTSLADSKAVLSSGSTITNSSSLDMYMDISVKITVASSTPRSGAYIGIWLAMLNQDGTTFGDNQLTAGSQTTYVPPWAPIAQIPLTAQAMTTMEGFASGILIPPEDFLLIAYNFANVTFSATAANNVIKYKTYNINLNS